MNTKEKQEVELTAAFANQILEQIPTPLMVVKKDLKISYLNKAGRQFFKKSWEEIEGKFCYELISSKHCQSSECLMLQATKKGMTLTARNELCLADKPLHIEYTAAPLKDETGEIVGGLEFILDITDRVQNEERLSEQSRTIREMSTPVTRLWDDISVIPVVGVVDSLRAQQMMESMLAKISETSSRIIIMDIQGVAAVDTAVANHFIKITKATKMMGCECIISGISSAVAQTLVHLGINLETVRTTATLKDALQEALSELGHVVQSKK